MPKVQLELPSAWNAGSAVGAVLPAGTMPIGEVLAELGRSSPVLRARLFAPHGRLRRSFAVYLNDDDVRSLSGESTLVHDGDRVRIVPSLGGG